MSNKKNSYRDAEVGGFWSTKNPNVFNGEINGVQVLLVRNLNKNNNTKFPEFRVYDKQSYSEVSMNIEIEKKNKKITIEKNIKENPVENQDFLIEFADIDFHGDF